MALSGECIVGEKSHDANRGRKRAMSMRQFFGRKRRFYVREIGRRAIHVSRLKHSAFVAASGLHRIRVG
jgi:hypothetical protein